MTQHRLSVLIVPVNLGNLIDSQSIKIKVGEQHISHTLKCIQKLEHIHIIYLFIFSNCFNLFRVVVGLEPILGTCRSVTGYHGHAFTHSFMLGDKNKWMCLGGNLHGQGGEYAKLHTDRIEAGTLELRDGNVTCYTTPSVHII